MYFPEHSKCIFIHSGEHTRAHLNSSDVIRWKNPLFASKMFRIYVYMCIIILVSEYGQTYNRHFSRERNKHLYNRNMIPDHSKVKKT